MDKQTEALNRVLEIVSGYTDGDTLPSMVEIQAICKGALTTTGKHSDYGYSHRKDRPWFFYDPDGEGLRFCDTEDEAKAGAEAGIKASLQDDYWGEYVDQIFYGRVIAAATQVDRTEKPESLDEEGYDEDGEYWPADCEFKCNYELLPIAATKETPND